jgi:AhpD family alkylhydroperoxidase
MQARITNPAILVPSAMQALQALAASLEKYGLPAKTLGLVHLRASQINGCSVCLDLHHRMAKKMGESDERNGCLSSPDGGMRLTLRMPNARLWRLPKRLRA